MTRRRVTIVEDGPVAMVRGWGVNELLVEAGIKPYFARGGWMVDIGRLPDLLAVLQRRRIAVKVTRSGSAPIGTHEPDASLRDHEDCADVPLWDPSGGDAA